MRCGLPPRRSRGPTDPIATTWRLDHRLTSDLSLQFAAAPVAEGTSTGTRPRAISVSWVLGTLSQPLSRLDLAPARSSPVLSSR